MRLKVKLDTSEGKSVEIELYGTAELKDLISEVRSALEHSKIRPIVLRGLSLVPSFRMLRYLEFVLELAVVSSPERPEEESKERGTTEVAQISDHLRQQVEKADGDFPWAEVLRKLNPGVQVKKHQIPLVNWLWARHRANCGGALVADDMGLGKSFQSILFLLGLRQAGVVRRPALIVAPLILVNNWQQEFEKFVSPSNLGQIKVLEGSLIEDPEEFQRIADKSGVHRTFLITYETLARYQRKLLLVDFGLVVLDESQAIKNPDSARSRAARALKSSFTITCTGTPVENRLRDLWSQVDSLNLPDGNPLGKLENFSNEYEKDPKIGVSKAIEALRPSDLSSFDGKDISSVVVRREKSILKSEIPPKFILPPTLVPMSDLQVYQEAEIVRQGEGKAFYILPRLQALYQHPTLISGQFQSCSVDELVSSSPKLAKTLEILESIRAKGEKALVFTLWKDMQWVLQRAVQSRFGIAAEIINGDVNRSAANVPRILKTFNATLGFEILVLSPLAAGTGLTITAANHVIHYGRWWNPAKEDQASDRAYRIGQTKPVTIYYPTLHHPADQKKGFDFRLAEHVEKKRALARDFFSPADASGVDDFDFEETS